MSVSDLRGEQLSTAGHTPSHCMATGHTPSHSTAGQSLGLLATPDLVVSMEGVEGVEGEMGEMGDGDNTCSSSNTHSIIRGNLDPYGNYGDKTIEKVAGMGLPSPLFDDSKYVEWSRDTDDVDSDCQSEYI